MMNNHKHGGAHSTYFRETLRKRIQKELDIWVHKLQTDKTMLDDKEYKQLQEVIKNLTLVSSTNGGGGVATWWRKCRDVLSQCTVSQQVSQQIKDAISPTHISFVFFKVIIDEIWLYGSNDDDDDDCKPFMWFIIRQLLKHDTANSSTVQLMIFNIIQLIYIYGTNEFAQLTGILVPPQAKDGTPSISKRIRAKAEILKYLQDIRTDDNQPTIFAVANNVLSLFARPPLQDLTSKFEEFIKTPTDSLSINLQGKEEIMEGLCAEVPVMNVTQLQKYAQLMNKSVNDYATGVAETTPFGMLCNESRMNSSPTPNVANIKADFEVRCTTLQVSKDDIVQKFRDAPFKLYMTDTVLQTILDSPTPEYKPFSKTGVSSQGLSLIKRNDIESNLFSKDVVGKVLYGVIDVFDKPPAAYGDSYIQLNKRAFKDDMTIASDDTVKPNVTVGNLYTDAVYKVLNLLTDDAISYIAAGKSTERPDDDNIIRNHLDWYYIEAHVYRVIDLKKDIEDIHYSGGDGETKIKVALEKLRLGKIENADDRLAIQKLADKFSSVEEQTGQGKRSHHRKPKRRTTTKRRRKHRPKRSAHRTPKHQTTRRRTHPRVRRRSARV